jgi:hypothetical protein
LKIVFPVVGLEAGLTPRVGGTAVFRRGDGIIGGLTVVVAAVVVVEGRNRGHEMRIESVEPSKEDPGIGLVKREQITNYRIEVTGERRTDFPRSFKRFSSAIS